MCKRFLTIGLATLAFMLAMTLRPSVARGDDPVDPNKAAFMGVWQLTLTPTDNSAGDGAKVFAEKLAFGADDIMAEAFAQYGFVSDGYWIFSEGPAFWGMMSSNSKGNLYWQGVASGSALSGYVVWCKNDGAVWTFTFTGSKN
jgi:hypothetical protein